MHKIQIQSSKTILAKGTATISIWNNTSIPPQIEIFSSRGDSCVVTGDDAIELARTLHGSLELFQVAYHRLKSNEVTTQNANIDSREEN